jgi:hypothetical protein
MDFKDNEIEFPGGCATSSSDRKIQRWSNSEGALREEGGDQGD